MSLIIISAIWLTFEIILTRIKHSNQQAGKADQGSQKFLWITILVSIQIGVLAGLQTFGRFDYYIYFYRAGVSLIALGLIIRWIAILKLKKSFTVDVAVSKNQKIINTGIYKYIRHPSYTGSLLSFLGLGTAFANYISMAVIFIPILIAFLYRIKIEEELLKENFGEEYIRYSARSKRLIPWIF